jgi:hypothetical protein
MILNDLRFDFHVSNQITIFQCDFKNLKIVPKSDFVKSSIKSPNTLCTCMSFSCTRFARTSWRSVNACWAAPYARALSRQSANVAPCVKRESPASVRVRASCLARAARVGDDYRDHKPVAKTVIEAILTL